MVTPKKFGAVRFFSVTSCLRVCACAGRLWKMELVGRPSLVENQIARNAANILVTRKCPESGPSSYALREHIDELTQENNASGKLRPEQLPDVGRARIVRGD